MSPIYVIVTLGICIAVAVIIWLWCNKSKKEHFEVQVSDATLSALAANVGIQPCSILKHPDMNPETSGIAHHFLRSNRLKEWRPKVPIYQTPDSNVAYCYFNNDGSNGMRDYVMAGLGHCSTENPRFQYPFIADAFMDNTYDHAYTAPFNKCVLKIDKTRLEPSDMEQFWFSIGSCNNECMLIHSNLYLTEREMREQWSACESNAVRVQRSNLEFEETMRQLNAHLGRIALSNESCIADSQTYYDNTLKARADIMSTNERIDSMDYYCKQEQAHYQNAYNVCAGNYKTLRDTYESTFATRQQKTEEWNTLFHNYNVLNSNIEIAASNMNYLAGAIQENTLSYSNLIPEYADCDSLRMFCYENNNMCNSNLLFRTQELTKITDDYTRCYLSLTDCRVNLMRCDSNVTVLSNANLNLRSNIAWHEWNITDLNSSNGKLLSTINVLDLNIEAEYERLRKRCNFTSNDKVRFASLCNLHAASYSNELSRTTTLESQINTNTATATQNTKDALKTCKNNVAEINAPYMYNIDTHYILTTRAGVANQGVMVFRKDCLEACVNRFGQDTIRRNVRLDSNAFIYYDDDKTNTSMRCPCAYSSESLQDKLDAEKTVQTMMKAASAKPDIKKHSLKTSLQPVN